MATEVSMSEEMGKFIELIQKEGINYTVGIDFTGHYRVAIPSDDGWIYSIICHHWIYGDPNSLDFSIMDSSGSIKAYSGYTGERTFDEIMDDLKDHSKKRKRCYPHKCDICNHNDL